MKEKEPLSFRLEPALHKRLEQCAERLRLKKYTLAILALEAAVDAIEKNGYRLALPIQFDVTHVATAKTQPHSPPPVERYPERRDEKVVIEERPISSDAKTPTAADIPALVAKHYPPPKKKHDR